MGKREKNEKQGRVARRESSGELTPSSPWGGGFGTGLERLMDRLFDEIGGERRPLPSLLAPAVDLSENDSHYTLSAELPGVDKNDVTIELVEGTLTLRGEKKTEHEEKTDRRRYAERTYGSFSRSLQLPRDAEADPARIEASFKDGVLTVKIPRSEEEKPAVIAIK